jgi:hypothetical protein
MKPCRSLGGGESVCRSSQGFLSAALPLTMALGIFIYPAHASVEGHGPNHLSVFAGNTDFSEHGSGLTLGVDYEYRLSPLLGLGSVVEYAYGSLDAFTVLAVADIHLTEQFIVQVGPGFEHSSEMISQLHDSGRFMNIVIMDIRYRHSCT